MREELLGAEATDGDDAVEVGLRPRRLDEFVGQQEVKDHLSILLEAAKLRGQAADHVLFAGPPGLGKPVDVDTLVLMEEGTRKRIGDIEVGDRVITSSGRAHAVLATFDQGELACLRITTHHGREVVAATDHPFLTPDGWTKAADLEVGSVLATVGRPDTVPSAHDRIDADFRMAGYIVGDGDVTSARTSVTNGDRRVLDDIHACALELGWATRELPNSPGSETICFRRARPWLRETELLGLDSHTKRVPEFVFRGTTKQVAHFLAAYFACDGHVSRRSRARHDVVIGFSSVNRELLADVQHLLLRLGVRSRIVRENGRYKGERHQSWRLTITSQDDAAAFAEQLPIVGDEHDRLVTWRPRRSRVPERLLPDVISAVEPVGLRPCRCITVDVDPTYTVGDLVCHNTSLAGIVAAELGVNLRITSGPALNRPGDLAAILTNLDEGDVLFVDEVHRLPRPVEEVLYPAMEDFQLDIVIGQGPAARSIRLELPRFTLVGATTRTGLLTGPLRDRFGLVERLDHYPPADLERIVVRAADILGVRLGDGGASEIARRSRGTPRIANRLLRRVRDFAEVRGDGTVSHQAALDGLALFGVDELGLDKVDRAVLDALCRRFGGGPVGLSTLAISVGEPTETVEDVYEPFLIREGLLLRTPRGRVATPAAWAHVGLEPPPAPAGPAGLFD